jgi:hypothetical protein
MVVKNRLLHRRSLQSKETQMIDRFSFSVIHTVAGRTYEASTLGALRCKRLAWCLQAGLPF